MKWKETILGFFLVGGVLFHGACWVAGVVMVFEKWTSSAEGQKVSRVYENVTGRR